MAFVYAYIVSLWADHILPQLLLEQFEILHSQCRYCRYIEHVHEGVCFKNVLGQNDSYEKLEISPYYVFCFMHS